MMAICLVTLIDFRRYLQAGGDHPLALGRCFYRIVSNECTEHGNLYRRLDFSFKARKRYTLQLRGGLWYSGSDGEGSSEEYSEEYTEEESSREQAVYGPQLPTEEEKAEAMMIPLGRWSAGQFPDIRDRFGLRDAREHGPLPSDVTPPHFVDEFYGLGNYTYLADERPNETYDINTTRSLLKVPPEELPPVFHWPCSGDGLGVLTQPRTLAQRFAEWTGPTPHLWQARAVSPRGVVMAHSVDRFVELPWDDVVAELGGEQCGAYFMHVSWRRRRLGQVDLERDGAWVPGPAAFTPNLICARANPPPPADGGGWAGDAPPADGEREDVDVPGDHRCVNAVISVKAFYFSLPFTKR